MPLYNVNHKIKGLLKIISKPLQILKLNRIIFAFAKNIEVLVHRHKALRIIVRYLNKKGFFSFYQLLFLS